MKRGLKGFAFLVSGLVLGIIGATVSATGPERCRHGEGTPCHQELRSCFQNNFDSGGKKHES